MRSAGTTLVTGASGFIGRHLVALLAERGVRVRACVLPAEPAAFRGSVDNAKLRAVGHRLRYPDFASSMLELGRRWRAGARDTSERRAGAA